MHRYWVFFLFFWLFAQTVGAQLPSGSVAPDFMVTDINGQQQHLYDALNDNKIVILEISATWCPPCWAYHQSQALQDFYAIHGPDGDDKARVFWVEGDPSTNLACIYGQSGCNSSSSGNFVAGTQYPILNSAAIANAYQISYYPSIFVICPNKRLFEVDPLSAEELWEMAQACPVASGANNAGIFSHDPGYDLPEICNTVELSPAFTMINLGTAPLTSANIIIKWDNVTVQSINWTGYLPTYGEAEIKFDSFLVHDAGSLNTVISSINNNAGDDDFSNNYINNNFSGSKHFEQTRVVLKIRTDNYGYETYWELHDDLGNVLEHGGNQLVGPNGGGAFPLGVGIGPGSYPSNTLIKDTLELPAGACYSIHFVDAYGDGMCCDYGNGYFKLYNIDNPALPIIFEGEFKAYDRHAFSAGALSSSSKDLFTADIDVQLFPNPASEVLNIDIETVRPENLKLKVVNALGQRVLQRASEQLKAGSNSLQLRLDGLPDGLYFLDLSTGNSGRPHLLRFLVRH